VVELPWAADSCPCVVEAANRVTINCWYQRRRGAVGVHLSQYPCQRGSLTFNRDVASRVSTGSFRLSPASVPSGHWKGSENLRSPNTTMYSGTLKTRVVYFLPQLSAHSLTNKPSRVGARACAFHAAALSKGARIISHTFAAAAPRSSGACEGQTPPSDGVCHLDTELYIGA
jgi:hypothetical protein